MNDLRVETPQVSHFLSQSSWSGCESAQACKMRRFISPDKDKVDRSESCHLAKFGTKCAFVRRASKEVPRSVKLFIPRQTERAPCGGRTYVWVNWLDLEIASIAALFLSPLFLSPALSSLSIACCEFCRSDGGGGDYANSWHLSYLNRLPCRRRSRGLYV